MGKTHHEKRSNNPVDDDTESNLYPDIALAEDVM
jgi:hypothetical protein